MNSAFAFGTVGAPLSTPKKPGGSPGAIVRLRELNLDAFELGWVQSVRVSPETCQFIKHTAAENKVQLSVHAPYFINLNATDEEWPKSRQRLMDAAFYGNLAGATDIIFHPGSYFGSEPEKVLPLAIDRLHECSNELRAAGNSVILRPETMGKSALIGSFEDVLQMSKAIQGVLPCLDFAHLHARQGDGTLNTYAEWMTLLEKLGAFLGKDALESLHIHLSGIEYSAKGERNHLPLRESDLNLQALFTALKSVNAHGRILCESPIMEDDALYMQELWQQTAQ